MSRFLKIVAGFVIGAILGAVIALGLSVLAATVFEISQMEGAYAMQVAFFYMPVGAVIGGIAGAIWTTVRTSKAKR